MSTGDTGEISIEAEIEKAPDSAACAIRVPTADVLRWFGRKSRVPVVAALSGYEWRTSLAPMDGCHLVPVNAEVRKGARVAAGDRVTLRLREDTAERTAEVPADLAAALAAANVRSAFDAMGYTHRKEWVRAVLDAKRAETRTKRIGDCVAAVRDLPRRKS